MCGSPGHIRLLVTSEGQGVHSLLLARPGRTRPPLINCQRDYQRGIATHVLPRHGAGTPATGTKFADDLGDDDLFSGLVERLGPGTMTGRIDEAGNHEHILNWVGAGANGENRVRVWMTSNGQLGGMWPIP